jgi:hypothetical protein
MLELGRADSLQPAAGLRRFSVIRWTDEAYPMELDEFDCQLLNLIQVDAGQTAERLAEQVPLSSSAIQRRLRRLREEGVVIIKTVPRWSVPKIW